MRLMKPVIQKKRFVSVILYETFHLIHKITGHILVNPPCILAALHIADSWDSVDDGIIMAVRPLHFQHLRVIESRRLPLKIFLIINKYRVIGFKPHHSAVLHKYCGDPVISCGNDTRIIESDFTGTRTDGVIPVNIAVTHTEMPFPDSTGSISSLLHHLRKSFLVGRNNQRRVAGQNLNIIAPWIHTCQQRITARGRS